MTPYDVQTSFLATFDEREFVKNLLLTAGFWGTAFGVRALVLKALRARGLSLEELRRYVATTRSVLLVILVVGTAALWFDELKVFALSLAAVAAALVVTSKELIMCVGGTFLRTSARSFEVGDRIEIGGLRGDVIDTSLFATTILEIGPGHVGHQRTGRSITMPNSKFLTDPIVNESFTETYVLHTFTVVTGNDASWSVKETALVDAAKEEMAAYAKEARAFFERMSRERRIETPTQDPRVLIQVDSPYTLKLICRLPAPARLKGRIEQAIVRKYLAATSSMPAPAVPPMAAMGAPAAAL